MDASGYDHDEWLRQNLGTSAGRPREGAAAIGEDGVIRPLRSRTADDRSSALHRAAGGAAKAGRGAKPVRSHSSPQRRPLGFGSGGRGDEDDDDLEDVDVVVDEEGDTVDEDIKFYGKVLSPRSPPSGSGVSSPSSPEFVRSRGRLQRRVGSKASSSAASSQHSNNHSSTSSRSSSRGNFKLLSLAKSSSTTSLSTVADDSDIAYLDGDESVVSVAGDSVEPSLASSRSNVAYSMTRGLSRLSLLSKFGKSKQRLFPPTQAHHNFLLHVEVVEGRDLLAADASGLSDPYVKLRLGNTKARTRIIDQDLNPIWKQSFTFPVSDVAQDLVMACFDYDRYSRDDFLGRIRIDVSELLELPRMQIQRWFPLWDKKERNKFHGFLNIKLAMRETFADSHEAERFYLYQPDVVAKQRVHALSFIPPIPARSQSPSLVAANNNEDDDGDEKASNHNHDNNDSSNNTNNNHDNDDDDDDRKHADTGSSTMSPITSPRSPPVDSRATASTISKSTRSNPAVSVSSINRAKDFAVTSTKAQTISLGVGTWNLGESVPPDDLEAWVPAAGFDVVVIGVQGCKYAHSKPHRNARSDWVGRLSQHFGENYELVSRVWVKDIVLTVFVHCTQVDFIANVVVDTVSLGLKNPKAAAAVGFHYRHTRLCFVTMALEPGSSTAVKNSDIRNVIKQLSNGPLGSLHASTMARSELSADLLHCFHHIFCLGDMAYSLEPQDALQIKTAATKEQGAGGASGAAGSSGAGGGGGGGDAGKGAGASVSAEQQRRVSALFDAAQGRGATYNSNTMRQSVARAAKIHAQKTIEQLVRMINKGNHGDVFKAHDTLLRQRERMRVLSDFHEALPDFPPTYPVRRDVERLEYMDDEFPAWADRVLWRSLPGFDDGIVQKSFYCESEIRTSSHKPVFSWFDVDTWHVASCHDQDLGPCTMRMLGVTAKNLLVRNPHNPELARFLEPSSDDTQYHISKVLEKQQAPSLRERQLRNMRGSLLMADEERQAVEQQLSDIGPMVSFHASFLSEPVVAQSGGTFLKRYEWEWTDDALNEGRCKESFNNRARLKDEMICVTVYDSKHDVLGRGQLTMSDLAVCRLIHDEVFDRLVCHFKFTVDLTLAGMPVGSVSGVCQVFWRVIGPQSLATMGRAPALSLNRAGIKRRAGRGSLVSVTGGARLTPRYNAHAGNSPSSAGGGGGTAAVAAAAAAAASTAIPSAGSTPSNASEAETMAKRTGDDGHNRKYSVWDDDWSTPPEALQQSKTPRRSRAAPPDAEQDDDDEQEEEKKKQKPKQSAFASDDSNNNTATKEDDDEEEDDDDDAEHSGPDAEVPLKRSFTLKKQWEAQLQRDEEREKQLRRDLARIEKEKKKQHATPAMLRKRLQQRVHIMKQLLRARKHRRHASHNRESMEDLLSKQSADVKLTAEEQAAAAAKVAEAKAATPDSDDSTSNESDATPKSTRRKESLSTNAEAEMAAIAETAFDGDEEAKKAALADVTGDAAKSSDVRKSPKKRKKHPRPEQRSRHRHHPPTSTLLDWNALSLQRSRRRVSTGSIADLTRRTTSASMSQAATSRMVFEIGDVLGQMVDQRQRAQSVRTSMSSESGGADAWDARMIEQFRKQAAEYNTTKLRDMRAVLQLLLEQTDDAIRHCAAAPEDDKATSSVATITE